MRLRRALISTAGAALLLVGCSSGSDTTQVKKSDSTTTAAGPTTTSTTAPITPSPQATRYSSEVRRDRPIAYWPLTEGSGRTVHDDTGRFNGTYRGRPTLAAAGPFGDRAVQLDGTSSRFVADALARQRKSVFAKGFTLEAWVLMSDNRREQHIIEFATKKGDYEPALMFDEPSWRFKYRDGSVSAESTMQPAENRWYYLVAAVDGKGNGTFYVNGVRQAGFSNAKRPPTDGLFQVGADYDTGPVVDTPWYGRIAEPAVYDHPLSAAQVKAHYSAGRP